MNKWHYMAAMAAGILAQGAFASANFDIVPSGALPTTVITGDTIPAYYTITNKTGSARIGYSVQGLPSTVTQTANVAPNGCSNPINLEPFASCTLQLDITGAVNSHFAICKGTSCTQSSVPLVVTVSKADNTLTASPATLAMSVNCTTAGGGCVAPNVNAALTGNPRIVTITNTSPTRATTALAVTSSGFPSNTSITADTCSGQVLAPSGTCTLTITPGQVASNGSTGAACTSGTQPVPARVSVSNSTGISNVVSFNVVVLGYGCQYQRGFLYSVNDQQGCQGSPPCTGSMGGSVIALNNQTSNFPNGIIWASNGTTGPGVNGVNLASTSADLIPGIDDISTSSVGSPTYAAFASLFSTLYTNTNPFTSASFSQCNGNTDGSCNTGNILTFYNQFITNNTQIDGGTPPFTASNGPTPLSYYAGGRCAAYTVDSLGNSPCTSGTCYNSWYLPAICEMGPDSGDNICSTVNVQQNIVDNLPFLVGNTCTLSSGCLEGFFWSSTLYAAQPTGNAWMEAFFANNGSFTDVGNESVQFAVRCSRALTP